MFSCPGTVERALDTVRLLVKSRVTAPVVLHRRLALEVIVWKPALHNVDQDVHLVDVPIDISQLFIFQEPLVEAGEDVNSDMVFRD